MTKEEKKEIYKKAFEYAKNDSNINKTILTRIELFEKQYSFLGDYVNYPSNYNQIASFLEKNSAFQKILKDATNEKIERDKIFKKLQKLINENKGVKDQIGQLQRNRGILIVGNDRDLIDGIVANLWYTFPQSIPLTLPSNLLWQKVNDSIGKYVTGRVGFWYENYTGWDEKNIKVRLLENQKGKMSLLFLRGLNGCSDILRGLAELVQDNREHGTLIINITRTNDLPHEFLDMTEKIYLKTTLFFKDDASTVIVNDKIFTDLQEKEYKLLKLLYNKKGDIANYKEIKENVFGCSTSEQQIHNTISSLKKKFKKYLDIKNKRGVGYVMNV